MDFSISKRQDMDVSNFAGLGLVLSIKTEHMRLIMGLSDSPTVVSFFSTV